MRPDGGVAADGYRNYFQGRRVLITGGWGFIGQHLCTELLALEAEVTLTDNVPAPESLSQHLSVTPRLRAAAADIRDQFQMERLVRGQEVIFDLAGKSGPADSNKAPFTDLDINCRGHLTVLEACRAVNPSVAVIFPSTRLVYGKPLGLPVKEDHPVAPESLYAVHKLAVENYLFMYARLYGVKATVLRISNPYGPVFSANLGGYGIANRFIQTAMDGGNITLFGDGSQRRDYLYIDDLVEVILRSACAEQDHSRIYNIGSGVGTSLSQLAERAVTATGRGRVVHVPWPTDYQAVETGDYVSDITSARRELGWAPAVEIGDGIHRTLACQRIRSATAA